MLAGGHAGGLGHLTLEGEEEQGGEGHGAGSLVTGRNTDSSNHQIRNCNFFTQAIPHPFNYTGNYHLWVKRFQYTVFFVNKATSIRCMRGKIGLRVVLNSHK